jgi:hypothetical protein
MGGSGGVREVRLGYKALPSQARFHKSKARFKGFSGPVGSGKSYALCWEAIRMCYLNPGRLGLLGAPTYPMLRDATLATLLEILGDSGRQYEHNRAENFLVLKDTRSKILFRPVEEFERLRGTNLAWFGLDELTYTQHEAWLRLVGRLRDPKAKRLCGFAAWTPKGYDWVYQKFVSEPARGYRAVIAAPFENRYLLNAVPDFYEQLHESYDQNFYEQEALGSYLSIDGGRVYPAFNRNDHVKDLAVNPFFPLLWALDFNVDPMSSLIAQVVGSRVHVLDEIVLRRGTTRGAAEEFLKRYPQHDAGLVVYGDASGFHQQTSGTSDFEMIQEYLRMHSSTPVSYRAPKANPRVRDRVNLVNGKLLAAAGAIGLLIDRKCKEMIKDFEQVCYKAETTQIDKEHDRLRTHLSDALGYLLWQECRPAGTVGEQARRLLP